MAVVMTGAALAAGLLAGPPSVSRAAVRHPSPQPSVASRVPGTLGGAAEARLIAAEARSRGRGI